MTFVLRTLEAASELIPSNKSNKPKARAALLWVDDEKDQLYIIGATYRFSDTQLKMRFGRGIGFAGSIWKTNRKRLKVDYPGDVDPEWMRQNWNFNTQEIEITRNIGTIISVPIWGANQQMVGILSIDSEMKLQESELKRDKIYKDALDFSKLISKGITEPQPFTYRKYRSLLSLIRTARLIPPIEIPIRAGIFWIDNTRQEMYMIAGSEEFVQTWKTDIRFKKGQALVGKVWEEEDLIIEDRSENNETYLSSKLNMTAEQIVIAKDTRSIVGMPILDDESNVIGVFILDSPEVMEKSLLSENENLVTFRELVKLAGKVLLTED